MTLQTGLFFVLAMVFSSILGLIATRRFLKTPEMKSQHDITDPYSQFVAMLFAVLLGFMVADSMQRFSQAKVTVQHEASALGNVYRLAEGVPAHERGNLQSLCKKYAKEVIEDEWPKLANKEDSKLAWDTYRRLWKTCSTYEPASQRQVNAQAQLLSAMQEVGENRRMRVEALHTGLPGELWAVLMLGGAATVIFTYFFSADSLRIQIFMVGMVSLVICLNLFLLMTYDDPFAGDVKVTPSAFETQLQLYQLDEEAKQSPL